VLCELVINHKSPSEKAIEVPVRDSRDLKGRLSKIQVSVLYSKHSDEKFVSVASRGAASYEPIDSSSSTTAAK
jgi:hypothetical protein